MAFSTKSGYRNMKVLNEGIVGWYQKRYPVEGTNFPSPQK